MDDKVIMTSDDFNTLANMTRSQPKWTCPVCGSTDGRDAAQFFVDFNQRVERRHGLFVNRIDFTVSSCRNCKAIFALPAED